MKEKIGKGMAHVFRRLTLPYMFRGIRPELRGRVLHIGSGTGRATAEIAKRFPDAKVFGMDIDKNKVKTAFDRLRPPLLGRVEYMAGDVRNTKLGEGFFDSVIAFNTFHHIENYEKALKELHRILRRRGTLYVTDFGRKLFRGPIRRVSAPVSEFTPEEFIERMEKAGFYISHSQGTRWFFFVRAVKW